MNAKVCKCTHHFIVPLLITGLGILFLLPQFGILGDQAVGAAWPVLLALIGITKLTSRSCTCC